MSAEMSPPQRGLSHSTLAWVSPLPRAPLPEPCVLTPWLIYPLPCLLHVDTLTARSADLVGGSNPEPSKAPHLQQVLSKYVLSEEETVLSLLCDLGQVTSPLWASDFLPQRKGTNGLPRAPLLCEWLTSHAWEPGWTEGGHMGPAWGPASSDFTVLASFFL